MPTFKVDLHIHTVHGGDSPMTGEEVLEAAGENGLDAVCVTEHDSYSASEPLEEVFKESDILLLRGAECSTGYGHLILLGITDDRFDELNVAFDSAQDIIDHTNSLGGAVIVPHPFAGGHRYAAGHFLDLLSGVSALEVVVGPALKNHPDANRLTLEAAERLGLPLVGGSDAHFPREVGRCYTEFERRIESMGELVRELRAGRFNPVPDIQEVT